MLLLSWLVTKLILLIRGESFDSNIVYPCHLLEFLQNMFFFLCSSLTLPNALFFKRSYLFPFKK